MKYNFAAVTLLMFILLTANITAQPFGQGNGRRGDCRLNNLNLNDEQQKKVDVLRKEHQTEVSKFRDELDRMRIDKRAMMRSDNLNRNDYLNLEKKMIELRENIALSGAEFRMDVYELLNEDQKKDFQKMDFNRKGRMGNRGGAMFRNQGKGFCR